MSFLSFFFLWGCGKMIIAQIMTIKFSLINAELDCFKLIFTFIGKSTKKIELSIRWIWFIVVFISF